MTNQRQSQERSKTRIATPTGRIPSSGTDGERPRESHQHPLTLDGDLGQPQHALQRAHGVRRLGKKRVLELAPDDPVRIPTTEQSPGGEVGGTGVCMGGSPLKGHLHGGQPAQGAYIR
jgi:hypothetical protein